jgi:small-conductance mechanosensitive channel
MDERILWPSRIAAWVSQNGTELLIGAFVAVIAVGVMLALRKLGAGIVASDPRCRTWRSVVGRVLAKTSVFFMVVAALDMIANYTVPPPKIAHPLDVAFIIAAALQAAIWGRELIMGVVSVEAGDEVGETALDNARSVIRVLVSIALFAIAAIVILDNLGVNVTALVAGLGIGGIAIGLAAQGIFSDLFAALSILFDRPFGRGDTIKYGNSTGTVERIGLKTTRLRSFTGEQMVMANTKLLEQEIRNMASADLRRVTLTFGLIYQTTPEQLRKVMKIAKTAVERHKGCTLFRCALTGFGASSLDFELIYDNAALDFTLIAADRTAIMIELIETFAKNGIEFAYPTQTTFTAAPDGKMVLPYPPGLAASAKS